MKKIFKKVLKKIKIWYNNYKRLIEIFENKIKDKINDIYYELLKMAMKTKERITESESIISNAPTSLKFH